MEIEVHFESDEFHTDGLCNQITITIDAFSKDGSDLDWDVVQVYDNTAETYRKLKDFTEEEQDAILEKCQDMAENEAPQIFGDYEGSDFYDEEY